MGKEMNKKNSIHNLCLKLKKRKIREGLKLVSEISEKKVLFSNKTSSTFHRTCTIGYRRSTTPSDIKFS